MKKILYIIFATLILSSILQAEITNDVDVKVRVNSKFEINVDRFDIDFGNMNPGEVKRGVPEAGMRVSVKTNSGSPWNLMVNALRELSNGDEFIPNKNFFWYGWKSKNSNGIFYGAKEKIFTTGPTLVYTPSVDEYNNLRMVKNRIEGTDVFVKMGLKIPLKQNSGDYHTVIRFTMTE
jgi:hypothetical protein